MSNTVNQFEWTDELVMEIIGLTHRAGYHKEPAKVYDRIEKFKQSKLSTVPNERIEVEVLQEYGSTLKHHVSDNGFYHPYSLRVYKKELPKDKFPAIKQAIENVLNDTVVEDKPKTDNSDVDYWEYTIQKGDTFKGRKVVEVYLIDNKVHFKTENLNQ
jgi:hypothetical protein